MVSWGSLIIVCHCAVSSPSLSWLHWVCAGAGRLLPLVHGGGGSLLPFVGGGGGPSSSFVLLCCLSIVTVCCLVATLWLFIVVSMVATVDVHLFATLLTATWHLDCKQWGGEVVVYSLGWPKTTRQCLLHRVDLTGAHLVGDMALQHCHCVVVCHGCCGQLMSIVGGGGHG